MYARVVEILFQTDKIQPIVERFRATSIGTIAALPGARAFMGCLSRETGRTYTISFWDGAAARDASASNPEIMENLTGYAGWMAGPFARDSCDVNLFTLAPIEPADPFPPEFVAAASVHMHPDHWDEALTILTHRTAEPGITSGFRGASVLTNPTSGRIIRVQLWDTLIEAQLAQERMITTDLELRLDGRLTGTPTYDTQEMAGRWTAR